MDGIGLHGNGCSQDPLHIQIALARDSRPDTDGFISQQCVKAVFIRLRIHGHGLYAHLTAGADDADRDFTSIGNQNLVKHRYSPSIPKLFSLYYPTMKVSSALTASLPSTVAVALPTPTGPFCLIISHSSFTLSPGTTLRLNLALSIPPK